MRVATEHGVFGGTYHQQRGEQSSSSERYARSATMRAFTTVSCAREAARHAAPHRACRPAESGSLQSALVCRSELGGTRQTQRGVVRRFRHAPGSSPTSLCHRAAAACVSSLRPRRPPAASARKTAPGSVIAHAAPGGVKVQVPTQAATAVTRPLLRPATGPGGSRLRRAACGLCAVPVPVAWGGAGTRGLAIS